MIHIRAQGRSSYVALAVLALIVTSAIVNAGIMGEVTSRVDMIGHTGLSSEPACNGNALINKTYGGTQWDNGDSLLQLGDGGFLIAASSSSYAAQYSDYWLIRTDAQGNALWNKSYDYYSDYCSKIIRCEDGGFVLFGEGNVLSGAPYDQYWLVKVYANATPAWNVTFGGPQNEYGYDAVEVSDGGFALFGYFFNETEADWDWWLVRTDEYGNHLWNRSYGGPGLDFGYSITATDDGGFLLVGTNSGDAYVVKTNETGDVDWAFSYGGDNQDGAYSAIMTKDGGYALAGWTNSPPSEVTEAWFVKISGSGQLLGEERYNKNGLGGRAYDIAEAEDGGFALVGRYYVTGIDSESWAWYIRTDSNGTLLWDFTFGALYDEVKDIIPVAGGGFALTGSTFQNSAASADASLILFPELSWVDEPESATIPYDSELSIDFNATSAAGIDVWSVNDTARFDIDSSGVLVNKAFLPSSDYGLQVSVSDNVGNLLTANITINVLPEPTTNHYTPTTTTTTSTTTSQTGDGTVWIVVMGSSAAAIVIIVLLLVLRRKKT